MREQQQDFYLADVYLIEYTCPRTRKAVCTSGAYLAEEEDGGGTMRISGAANCHPCPHCSELLGEPYVHGLSL